MSLLTVTGLTHGFGDRAIFNNVSFQLNRLDKIGLVGANGEGKSTFMNIITGKLMPDEGKVEWAKNVRVGYLDQHAVLEKGMTIQSVLASAFDFLYDMENQMNEIYAGLGDASPEEMDKLMAEAGTIQDLLTMHDFYMIDAKVEEVARALGLTDLGLDKDVTELSGGQRTKVLLGKLLLEKPDMDTFKGLKYAYSAIADGGSMPTVFNAANECAVAKFLDRKIRFLDIYRIIEECMASHTVIENPDVSQILDTERWVYDFVESRW